MASNRHLARIIVMQTLFAYEFRGGDPLALLEYNAKEFKDKIQDLSFAEALLQGILKHKDQVMEVIQTEAPEWPIDKVAPVDRAVLEMGVYEIIFSEDVPPVVAINEAVEIAKMYGDVNSPKFVNGVLSTVMHKYKPEAKSKAEKLSNMKTNEESAPNA